MEVQAEYVTEAEPIIAEVFNCPECDAPLGNFVVMKNKICIKMNGAIFYSLHGWCISCDAELHHTSHEAKLDRLLERRKERAKLTTT